MPTTPTPGQLSGSEPTPRPTPVNRVPQSPGSPPAVSWRSITTVSMAAALCATVAWVIVGPLTGTDLAVHDGLGARDVGVVSVVVSTLLIGATGGGLLRWWQRRSTAGTRRWSILAVIVAVLSLLGPTSADTLHVGMALVSLHAVVAVVVIVGLTRSRRC